MHSPRMLLSSLGLMALFQALYYFPYPAGTWPAALLDGYLQAQARGSGALIGLFDDSVVVSERFIRGRFGLEIVKSCSSLDVQALAAAAVLAFPATAAQKAWGLCLSVGVITFVNQVRIASLYWLGLRAPEGFDAVHEELFPLAFVLLACATFLAWTRWVRGDVVDGAGAA